MLKKTSQSLDDRRDVIILDTHQEAIRFTADYITQLSQNCDKEKQRFSIAISGGNTPKPIYSILCHSPYIEKINWPCWYLFFSDERAESADHKDNNYCMAMQAGFSKTSLSKDRIFRMVAEKDIEKNAQKYSDIITSHLGEKLFDLVLLGMGEDGHVASLFPQTKALDEENKLVVANYILSKDIWRMTLTYPCINRSKKTCLCVFGKNKAEMVYKILSLKEEYPAAFIGTKEHKALWILDKEASALL